MKLRQLSIVLVLSVATVAIAQQSSSSRSDRSDRSSRRSSSSRDRRSSSYSGGNSYATSQPVSFMDAYRLVLDRNIFSKNRVIYREASTMPTGYGSSSYQTQPALSLTGVTREGGVATALIEDRRSGQTSFYHVGDVLGGGKITAIDLNSIEYQANNGQAMRVELGSALTSGPTYTVASSSGRGPTTGPSSFGAAPASGGGDSSDLLERLRQRRLQETKK